MMIFRALLIVFSLIVTPGLAAESASTAALFAQSYPLTRTILVADFPQDLQALEQRFSEIDNTEISPQLKLERAFLELTALRKKYAPNLRYARTELSAVMVLSLAEFYRAVLRREGPAVCAAFAADGAATLLTLGQGALYAQDLDRQAATYFSAVASAFENPDVVGAASEDDWKMVMGTIIAAGHPPSYVASIATAKADDPDLCSALLALFQAMVVAQPDAAQRVRAEFVQGATGY
ncbi:MAG TPA: hypothetical protein VL133_06515 [Devosia sp.]|nr:hypothetical protein [Devosia sp.]